MPEPSAFDAYLLDRATTLRSEDKPPANLAAWKTRRTELRKKLFAAMGEPEQDKPCDLTPRLVATLKRKGYRIENLLLRSRPDVWMTANAYIPEGGKGKLPAVLVVHGHWAGARRDPVVQARCLGLMKLGYFVLAVDAFGAGERHPTIKEGSYHGALLGSTLWPVGRSLLGLQVYDNRRAVDYLVSRDEVDKSKLGITGASGGGNQSMYAGALDERFAAVVPVCSVGTYRSYLSAACCVCEVLPGALTFTEEGDVLGLVAPRALMVINATKDAPQFSVAEAKKSLERAKAIFELHDKKDRCVHVTFESPHAYNKPMREAMYGWMTRWLKNEGKGEPIEEPAHDLEKPEDLACFPGGKRPESFVFPSTLAATEAKRYIRLAEAKIPNHKEAWEAKLKSIQDALTVSLGRLPKSLDKPAGKFGTAEDKDDIRTRTLTVKVNEKIDLPVLIQVKKERQGGLTGIAILLHLEGKAEALKHPLAKALVERDWLIYAPDLRATGTLKPVRDGIGQAPDHNSAEHALWIGEPLLGQWCVDVWTLFDFLGSQPGLKRERLAVVGLGQAGLVALAASGAAWTSAVRPTSVALIDTPTTLVSASAYPDKTRMGLLAPGILKAGDVPHLAGVLGPRKLLIVGGVDAGGKALSQKALEAAYAFTKKVYDGLEREKALTIEAEMKAEAMAAKL